MIHTFPLFAEILKASMWYIWEERLPSKGSVVASLTISSSIYTEGTITEQIQLQLPWGISPRLYMARTLIKQGHSGHFLRTPKPRYVERTTTKQAHSQLPRNLRVLYMEGHDYQASFHRSFLRTFRVICMARTITKQKP